MIGVPSVIMGVFLYAVWVVPRGTEGRSAIAGALALAASCCRSWCGRPRRCSSSYPRTSVKRASPSGAAPRGRRSPSCCPPHCRGSPAAACSPSPARPVKPHHCCSRSVRPASSTLGSPASNTALVDADLLKCHPAGVANRSAWGAALTLIVLVLLLHRAGPFRHVPIRFRSVVMPEEVDPMRNHRRHQARPDDQLGPRRR